MSPSGTSTNKTARSEDNARTTRRDDVKTRLLISYDWYIVENQILPLNYIVAAMSVTWTKSADNKFDALLLPFDLYTSEPRESSMKLSDDTVVTLSVAQGSGEI